MAKLNYIRALLDSLEEEKLRSIIEDYAKKDRSFEAFVIEQSGQAVDTGKHFEDYRKELMSVLNKCRSRKRGFVKVTRLKNAGMDSFYKLMNSHFSNENYLTALWMSLALLEMMHRAILFNTRYQWAHKPYKSFEKILLECREKFDSSYRFTELQRNDRPQIFSVLMNCWWNERQYEHTDRYFNNEDLLMYIERDEDVISLQKKLHQLKEGSGLDGKKTSWKESFSELFSARSHRPLSLKKDLQFLEQELKEKLHEWR